MSVALRHPRTGEIKIFSEQGWSWGVCIGSAFLGIPLFRRGLQVWGAAMLALNTVLLVVEFVPTQRAATLYLWLSLIGVGLCVFLGFQANQMAIDRYLSLGWESTGSARKFF